MSKLDGKLRSKYRHRAYKNRGPTGSEPLFGFKPSAYWVWAIGYSSSGTVTVTVWKVLLPAASVALIVIV
jgi:hypothetical protein